MKIKFRDYFISGFFVLIPIGLSFLVVWWFIQLVDKTLAPFLDTVLGLHIPGLGLAAAVLAVFLAGLLTSHVIGERLLALTEEVFLRIPVFKWVYGTVKQTVDAFSPDHKTSFKSVVVVEYPRSGIYSLGFVTNQITLSLPDGSSRELVSVYIPTNHVYFGDIVMFRKEEVIDTQLSVQQGIQCSLSAGAAIPQMLGKK